MRNTHFRIHIPQLHREHPHFLFIWITRPAPDLDFLSELKSRHFFSAANWEAAASKNC